MMIRLRFEDRYIPEPNSGCWLWIGPFGSKGYGAASRLSNSRYPVGAHRLSWELHHGHIPKGICVLHKCDNKICVNPDHLFLGTNADNMADRDRKGRLARGLRHGCTKLTEGEVLAIREDPRTEQKIAVDYGVSPTTIGAIRRRKLWRCLD